MLELDECNQLLVTNPFQADDVLWSNVQDTLVSVTPDPSSERHPLRSRSVSPARRTQRNSPVTVIGSEDGTHSLDRLSTVRAAEEDLLRGENGMVIHPVGSNDSFAGVALRYGVSIAAIRRANQLWTSDPIHLRTELLIPRGDAFPARYKPSGSGGTVTPLSTPTEATSGFFPISSSFLAARNIILSLPARMSLESLSSKASTSEDHEMDDLQAPRAHEIPAIENPFEEEGYELSILATRHRKYRRPSIPLSFQAPTATPNHQPPDLASVPPISNLRSRSICSSAYASREQLLRTQPFAVQPVRTSQLEPEPAMELPVRRTRSEQPPFFWRM